MTVKQDGSHQLEVRQDKAEEKATRRTGVTLTEEAFWELLEERVPGDFQAIRRLVEEYGAREGIEVEASNFGLLIRLAFLEMARPPVVFAVTSSGVLGVWSISGQIAKAGIDRSLGVQYYEEMRRILKMSKSRKEFYQKFAEVDIGEFTRTVDAFIEEVRQAAADL